MAGAPMTVLEHADDGIYPCSLEWKAVPTRTQCEEAWALSTVTVRLIGLAVVFWVSITHT